MYICNILIHKNNTDMNTTGNLTQYDERTETTCQGDVCETSFHSQLRNISIQPLSRGYVLNVGCQSVAVSNKESLKQLLNMYIDNPQQTEEDYYAGKILPKD